MVLTIAYIIFLILNNINTIVEPKLSIKRFTFFDQYLEVQVQLLYSLQWVTAYRIYTVPGTCNMFMHVKHLRVYPVLIDDGRKLLSAFGFFGFLGTNGEIEMADDAARRVEWEWAVAWGHAHADASKRSFRRVNALQTHPHTASHTHIHTLRDSMAYSLWLMALMWPLLVLRSLRLCPMCNHSQLGRRWHCRFMAPIYGHARP